MSVLKLRRKVYPVQTQPVFPFVSGQMSRPSVLAIETAQLWHAIRIVSCAKTAVHSKIENQNKNLVHKIKKLTNHACLVTLKSML